VRAELAVVCPITKQAKGYPFEVPIAPGQSITGVVLVDQIRAIDWKSRNIQFKPKCPQSILNTVQGMLRLLLP
jgi:mRNA interferase MazF